MEPCLQPPAVEDSAELIARGIAPVKVEFRRVPPSSKASDPSSNNTLSRDANEEGKAAPVVTKEKKSKRQLKRERKQEKKSAINLCPDVRKKGLIESCAFGSACHFSHDVEAFRNQKPDDLDGDCPFAASDELCPYGLACRFYGTHKEGADAKSTTAEKGSEANCLSKDVQRLLWKNKLKLPKADAVLKSLGLTGKFKANKTAEEDADGTHLTADNNYEESRGANGENKLGDDSPTDDSRPLKRSKANEASDSCGEAEKIVKTHPREKRIIDFRGKVYLAPLTTVGNLPFRRVCKAFGADVTCGEMAMCTNLLQGQASEWALLRRHSSENLFGVQICGSYPDTVARAAELINTECSVDFIDVNMGCPIDIIVNKGAGSCLLTKPMRMKGIIQAASSTVDTPITVKVRTGYFEGKNRIDSIIADIGNWGAAAVSIHGRTRQQRYSKLADWDYINKCVGNAPENLQVIGNGDIFSYVDWNKRMADCPKLSSGMVARGAIIKPWLITEIKEQRHWDISSGERLDMLKDFVRYGLQHWGSDTKGVETTRHFLLEWLSYLCRYVPVGVLDVLPQQLNWRPPSYYGRDDLETLMSSDSAADWVRISEILLGKVPDGFSFSPKHKSNAYDKADNG